MKIEDEKQFNKTVNSVSDHLIDSAINQIKKDEFEAGKKLIRRGKDWKIEATAEVKRLKQKNKFSLNIKFTRDYEHEN